MMKWLQKLGKALMLPVAALPVCGILMGIGYALAPAVMGAEGPTTGAAYTIGFLLVKAGGSGQLFDDAAAAQPRCCGHHPRCCWFHLGRGHR